MSLSFLGWLFALGVVTHNIEEAVLFPALSVRFGRWYASLRPRAFRFAAIVLSAVVLAAALLASLGGARSVGAYLITGYAFAMVLNAFVPHVMATIALRAYVPGTATALLLNLPLGSWLLYRSFVEGYVQPTAFAIVGPVIILSLLASIPLLFTVGEKLTSRSTRPARTQAR
jgi:hypothetical protein